MQKAIHEYASPSLHRVLRISGFRHLWIGQFCSQLGSNMLLSLLALRIYELTRSNTAVSILYVTYGIPALLFGMLAGVVVDHIDKRKTLVFCNMSRVFLMLPLLFFHDNLVIVYIIMFLNAIVSQFYLPSEAPLIPRLIPEKYLLTANSLFSFTFFSSVALGFVLAGPALKHTGIFGSFLILIVLFLTAIWSVTKIPRQPEDIVTIMRVLKIRGMHVVKRLLQDLFRGILFAVSSIRIADALVLLTATQIVLAILGTLGPGFADQVLKIDITDVSFIILGPAVLGIIFGALWIGNYGSVYSARRLTTVGLFSGGIFLAFISLIVLLKDFFIIPRLFFLSAVIILFFLLGISNSFLDVSSNATLQKAAEGTMRGRIYGILSSVIGGIGIIPVVAGGVFADMFGIGNVLLFLGLCIIIYGIIRLRSNVINTLIM